MARLWKLIALPFFLGLVFLATYLYFYLGGYKDVVVQIKKESAHQLVFLRHRGPYHQINEKIMLVEAWAIKMGIDCSVTFGHYLDDPKTMEEAQLQSHGGCVLTNNLNEAQKSAAEKEGFLLDFIPEGNFVSATFNGSPAIGPWKVYPKLNEFVQKNALKTDPGTYEFYKVIDTQHMLTDYLIRIK